MIWRFARRDKAMLSGCARQRMRPGEKGLGYSNAQGCNRFREETNNQNLAPKTHSRVWSDVLYGHLYNSPSLSRKICEHFFFFFGRGADLDVFFPHGIRCTLELEHYCSGINIISSGITRTYCIPYEVYCACLCMYRRGSII